jgi:hypothetical protein
MAHQPAPSAEQRVKAFDKLRRLVDAPQPGPTKVEARRVGNALINFPISEDAAAQPKSR